MKRVAVAVAAALLTALLAAWSTSPTGVPVSDGRAELAAATTFATPQSTRPSATVRSGSIPQRTPRSGTTGVGKSAPSGPPAPVIGSRAAGIKAFEARPAGVGPPTLLSLSRLDISMRIVPVGVTRSGVMSIPDNPAVAGWYSFGAAPGDSIGPTVIAAHVDSAEAGIGPLAQIGSARPGDRIEISSGTESSTYAVASVSRIPKDKIDLAQVFSRSGPPRLHLLTCGGAWDETAGHYEDNILLVARLVTPPTDK